MTIEKKLAPWRQFRTGRRVEIATACGARHMRGQRGTVIELLMAPTPKDEWTGLMRYGVRLDSALTCTADFSRFELKGLKTEKGRPLYA